MGWVIDDPSALLILVDAVDLVVELGALVELVKSPEVADLPDDLLLVRVALLPIDGGMEAVHERMDLEARGFVDALHTMLN